MKDGRSVNIELRGISRNGSAGMQTDGCMDEIINLRQEAGTLRPVGAYSSLNRDVDMSGYDKVFVHTTAIWKNYLGVRGKEHNYSLEYFAIGIENSISPITPQNIGDCGSNDVEFNQAGNIAVLCGESTYFCLRYDVKSRKYIRITNDFNGQAEDRILPPNLDIRFRVDLNTYTPTYSSKEIPEPIITVCQTAEDARKSSEDERKECSKLTMQRILRKEREKGRLKGFFKLIYAYELFDGSHILQSQPILMPQANDKCVRWSSGNLNYLTDDVVWYQSFLYGLEAVWNEVCIRNYGSQGWTEHYEGDNNIYYRPVAPSRSIPYSLAQKFAGIDYTHNLFCCIGLDDEQLKRDMSHYTHLCVSYSNRLQYKIKSGISSEYKDVFKGVSVFITREVYGYDTGSNSNRSHIEADDYKVENYIFNPKTDVDIIKELEANSVYYKVANISFDKLQSPTKEWVDIDLGTDKILANLEAQDRLRVSEDERKSYMPKTSFTYNGRLHIADYRNIAFRGFPLNYFYNEEGRGQFETKRNIIWRHKVDNEIRDEWRVRNFPMISVEVDIETNTDDIKVVRYEKVPLLSRGITVDDSTIGVLGILNENNGVSTYSLNPMVSYPDGRAKKITITIQDCRDRQNYLKRLVLPLKEDELNNCAYYISPDLKPIDITVDKVWNSTPLKLPQSNFGMDIERNMLKVSQTGNPLYFPLSNTYRVGSGRIIKLMSNTVSVGEGQTGAAPLMVFCSDGIWALMVDASGQVAYTNSRPISRDVINGRDNAKNVQGGIVFATDRGLMLLSGAEVMEIGETVEGRVSRHFESSPSAEKLLYARELYDNEKSVRLLKSIDLTEFKDYLKDIRMGYNYNKQELMVANPNKEYYYVLSAVGRWYKLSGKIRFFVEDYPKTYACIANKLLNVGREEGKTAETGFVTRAMRLGEQTFKRLTRVILRGWFGVERESWVNHIDCRDINMTPRTEDRIDLRQPSIRSIKLKPNKSQITELFNPEKQSKRISKTLDISVESSLRYSYSGKGDIEVEGELYFPKEQYLNLFAEGSNSIIEAAVKLKYAISSYKDGFKNLTVNGLDRRTYTIYINYTNCGEVNEDRVAFRSSTGDEWYSESGNVYNNNFETVSKNWERTGEKIIRVADFAMGSAGNPLTQEVAAIPYVRFPIKMVIPQGETTVPIFIKEGNGISVESEGVEAMINSVTLSYDTYYTFRIPQSNSLTKEDNVGVKRLSIDDLSKSIVSGQDCILGTLRPTARENLLAETGSRVLGDYEIYNVMWTQGTHTLPYITLLENMKTGKYSETYKEIDTTFLLEADKAYALNTLDSDRYVFFNDKGDHDITYSRLVSSIRRGVYPDYDENGIIPEYVYLSKGRCITVINGWTGNSIGDGFVYTGETGRVSSKYILEMTQSNNPNKTPIPYINSGYMLRIKNNSKILVQTDSQSWRIIFKELPLNQSHFDISASQLINNITLKKYEFISDYDKGHPIFLREGATRLVTREGIVYEIDYVGDSPIPYDKLIQNLEAGKYAIISPQTQRYAGLYVYGSYDGKQWALLGRVERTGEFRDLGCLVERNDCKYYKIMFFGNLNVNSEIDYLEVQGGDTLYGEKIR
jgi:hypothetical protein